MKVLLTSGGTKVPIDTVRSITNMSRGTFGSKIARQLLRCDNVNLIYLGAKEFRMPFSIRIDFAEVNQENVQVLSDRLLELAYEYLCNSKRYKQYTYKTFNEYTELLEKLIKEEKPDVVVLAAAVSDYVVADPMEGKIRSGGDLTIELKHAPKLIGKVKKWLPDCHLVGFKLLVNSTDDELIESARKSLEQNGCDFIVANDLRDIRAGKHRLLIVDNKIVEEIRSRDDDPDYLAKVIADKISIMETQ
jgi:phosphopantothenate---cysteine ligase (CTP)